ncbi:VOC family protein [Arthrobacter sp. NIO-1057]|uniref:VOC family protein n=1 Tax=Arthrobacter sp. NIO-1057 TaxID=993071 RepID=UPI00071DAD5B|nr:VOC family protein [Arthrobacter sp. NIO-1057]KSU67821.1 glyoxalase [Arthrobacter sp. NIO-1057]SCB80186.1 Glyoxalase/Bleomycin resistance protein/Dioxygenase superfamily protein [Arthrobacter sp. NIO-1057]
MLHHLEIWVDDLAASTASLGWLLSRIGYQIQSQWGNGISYEFGDHYIVLESGPDVLHQRHERRSPGLNHFAFSLPNAEDVEAVVAESIQHGFTLMFADKHPYAGGPHHYAAYLEDNAGFEVELVAVDSSTPHAKQQG